MNHPKTKKALAFLLCVLLLAACGSSATSESPEAAASIAPTDKPPASETGGSEGSLDTSNLLNLGTFESQTLEGDTLSQDILADYDLTVINIWATWCPPCIAEMADLQIVSESLPDNVNFFTICDDATEQRELAQTILDENGCTFPVLEVSDSVDENIMRRVQSFPTTLFVNSEGYVVHALEGAPSEDISQFYLDMTNTVLEQL